MAEEQEEMTGGENLGAVLNVENSTIEQPARKKVRPDEAGRFLLLFLYLSLHFFLSYV
jgi:hypothetical protein